ncbi:hypothetical protein TWF694_000001 [Orbilia ellipsospora]|uniref:Uncharacterized protein n=1 Tax=Orbilia ellipsospora TaxID=2528407 RepID=A0AAV9XM99_9PEZI
MFPRFTTCRQVFQTSGLYRYVARRGYTKGVDPMQELSSALAEWRLAKLVSGGVGVMIIGKTIFDFTLHTSLAVFEEKMSNFEGKMSNFEEHLKGLRGDIGLIKIRVLSLPVSSEVV